MKVSNIFRTLFWTTLYGNLYYLKRFSLLFPKYGETSVDSNIASPTPCFIAHTRISIRKLFIIHINTILEIIIFDLNDVFWEILVEFLVELSDSIVELLGVVDELSRASSEARAGIVDSRAFSEILDTVVSRVFFGT